MSKEKSTVIQVGSVIANREVLAVFENKYCLAKCREYSPEPFTVWNIDANGEGVHTGRYYVEREDAQWCYSGLCFPWFQDNVHINMIEDEPTENVETQTFDNTNQKSKAHHPLELDNKYIESKNDLKKIICLAYENPSEYEKYMDIGADLQLVSLNNSIDMIIDNIVLDESGRPAIPVPALWLWNYLDSDAKSKNSLNKSQSSYNRTFSDCKDLFKKTYEGIK